jgi:hypothetical protein
LHELGLNDMNIRKIKMKRALIQESNEQGNNSHEQVE